MKRGYSNHRSKIDSKHYLQDLMSLENSKKIIFCSVYNLIYNIKFYLLHKTDVSKAVSNEVKNGSNLQIQVMQHRLGIYAYLIA